MLSGLECTFPHNVSCVNVHVITLAKLRDKRDRTYYIVFEDSMCYRSQLVGHNGGAGM